jgi:hypothetical protein
MSTDQINVLLDSVLASIAELRVTASRIGLLSDEERVGVLDLLRSADDDLSDALDVVLNAR